MCDTFIVVLQDRILFGKNSDRDPNEAQLLSWLPAARHRPGTPLRCTWTRIPQVARTHAALLSRPFWMWGAEMGANEHGVVIGNEAVFTRPRPDSTGLLGMDLVRLGLERAASAEEAVAVIRALIEEYGQGGRAAYGNPALRYDNSFLIADWRGAHLLEAVGKDVDSRVIGQGCYAISNALTLPALLHRRDRLRSWAVRARQRRNRVEDLAERTEDIFQAMQVLRDHGAEDEEPRYRRGSGAMQGPCVHAGGRPVATQTTASWVSELSAGGVQHWCTGTAAPCLSLFRPVAVESPRDIGRPTGAPDGQSLWWRFESVHRQLLQASPSTLANFHREREMVQERLLEELPDDAWQIADDWLARWSRGFERQGSQQDPRPDWLRHYWLRIEEQARDGSRLPWREA